MSLPTLPDDALGRVCSRLHRRDRQALRDTSKALRHALRPGNCALWQDVYLNKFGAGAPAEDAAGKLHLHEYAAEALCFRDAWEPVVPYSLAPPIAAVCGERAYVAFGARLRAVGGPAVNLETRATAITATHGAVAVAWNRAVSVYRTDANGNLTTTRPLRGHNTTVRSATFLCDGKYLATGADNGTVRLHDVKSRRTRGVLRAHSGAVVQQQVVTNGLLSRAGERVVVWDVVKQRATRTYAGGKFVASPDGTVVYALAPGDACAIRVYDVRQESVAAFLSLPRHWERRPIGDFVLDADGGGVVGAVGERGIVHWPGIGRLDGLALSDPLKRRPVREPVVCIRGGVAVAAAAGMNCEIVTAALDRPFVVEVPWPDREGGAFTQLETLGEKLLACREHEAIMFDHTRKSAVIDLVRARRAILVDDEDMAGGGSSSSGIGRFWQTASELSDDEAK